MSQVVVVVDPEFGSRLRELQAGSPVWVTMSPTNEAIVRSLWASAPASTTHLDGITGFRHDARRSPEDQFLAELSTIDLHHGPYSAKVPYDALRVIGCKLTCGVRDALTECGFQAIEETADGFLARRVQPELDT
jgi:hypothetical protein